jgi:penicillin-binding protein 1A
MSDLNNGTDGRNKRMGSRRGRNTFVTKSGQTIRIHRNLSERIQASRDAKARRRAARLAGLPKSRVKRFFYHFHPKRMYHYWFSREGGIMALKITGIGIIAGFLLLVGVFAYFRKDLPNLKDISGSNIGGSIRYYDRTGQTLLWEDYDGVKRVAVQDKEISQHMKNATVAIEDKDFFNHGGFDVRGIMRAAVTDVMHRDAKQGGSTITQQLVKLNNKGWTQDRTINRKIKELILAVELERSYSKQEILNGYLNAAPYGNVQYGVEVAARDYFQKSAKDLTIAEAAFLAGIPKSPSYYSPYGVLYKEDPAIAAEDVKGRQAYILQLMREQNMITQKEYEEAKKQDTLATIHTPTQKFDGIKAPYFVLTAKDQLEAKYGQETVNRGGWKVITTLDLNMQTIAEEQVQNGLARVKRQGGDQIALAAEDVTNGQMVALVGGVDWNNEQYGKYNYATAKIPPGSTFKPYDYTAMIENTTNTGAGSVIYDTKGALPGYPCTKPLSRTGDCAIDYDLRFPGPLTLRYALGGSRNIPAMKAMLSSDSDPQKSVNKTIAVANNMMGSPDANGKIVPGIYGCYDDEALKIPKSCFTSAAIGDGAYLRLDQNVHGYGTLSRNGLNIPQTYILKIEDVGGKVVDEWKPTKGVQVVRPESAYIISDVLGDPNASYLSRKPHKYKGWNFSFKTGTTNDSKDGLMMGMSTKYAVGAWVGYHDRTREMTGFMEDMTQPIISGWMNKAHENLKPVDRVKPSGLQTLPAFVVTTHVGVGSREPSPANDLYPSWYKATKPGNNTKSTIDIVSNKVATDCTPARAKKEITSNANSYNADRFVAGGNANTSEKDDIHKCDDAKPDVKIISAPALCSSSCSITVQVTKGTHPLSSGAFPGSVAVVIGGQTVQSFPVDDSQSGSPMNLTFSFSGTGSQQITTTVVDSVLYDASDSATVNFSGGGGSAMNLDADRQNPTTVRFTWSGGTGPFNVRVGGNPVPGCTNQNDNSCNGIVGGGGGTATIEDSAGNTANATF